MQKANSSHRDSLQRPLRDLRISVTDRCNLRCTYCMPGEVFGHDFVFLARAELLSFEEILRVVREAIPLGVKKVRLSGGEPLLRHGIERLIEQLARFSTSDGEALEVAMTTNGLLLAKRAQGLKAAGLTRLNISLDALDEEIFHRMSGSRQPVAEVLAGIEAASRAGLTPLKVNAVIRRGWNEGEVLPLARHFRHTGVVLRFIEFMDVGESNGWRLDEVMTARDILKRIDAEFPLQPLDPDYPGEVAERWAYADGGGEVGVIASVTQAFCRSCSRLRLSTDGKLYTCLFASTGADLRDLLRSDADDAFLRERIAAVWRARTDRYSELRNELTSLPSRKIEMSYIGG